MTVALSRGGDRAILTALGAMASLTAADVPASLLAARPARARELLLPARGLARARAGRRCSPPPGPRAPRTSLDTNWDPAGRWRDERLPAAIAQADLLLPNEAEALR